MRTLLGALTVASSLLMIARPVSGQHTGIATTVEVQNNFKESVAVFVESGQFDVRIGTVDPISIATLPLPEWVANRDEPVRLFVVHRGEDLATQSLEVRPGEKLGIMVPPEESRPAHIMTANLSAEELSKTTLTVKNDRDRELVVYAERGNFQVRLGRVAAHGQATLEFPTYVVRPDNTITVIVQPRGEFELESHPLILRPGEHLGLELEPL